MKGCKSLQKQSKEIDYKQLKNTIMKKDIRNYKSVGVQYAYVLDCIYSDSVDVDSLSDKEKVMYFFDCFNNEYNYDYNKRCYPNLQVRIAEYLKGLPACIGIAFSDYDIEQIGIIWGNCKEGSDNSRFIYNWRYVIAYRLLELKEYYNI